MEKEHTSVKQVTKEKKIKNSHRSGSIGLTPSAMMALL
jgi:hypothetical protein